MAYRGKQAVNKSDNDNQNNIKQKEKPLPNHLGQATNKITKTNENV